MGRGGGHFARIVNTAFAADFTKRYNLSDLELGRVTRPNLGWVQCVLLSLDAEP